MKLLFINQFYWPDRAATSQLLTDLTRVLGHGHDVTVICSKGIYQCAESRDDEAPPPVTVIRIPGLSHKRGLFRRAISYATFLIGTLWHEFRLPHQDIVVTMTTPPMLGICGSLLKRLRGSRHIIWEMDVFPDVLVTIGALSERGWAARLLTFAANAYHRDSDGIIALGPCMRDRLIARGIPGELVQIAENWSNSEEIRPSPGRRRGPLRILYSGNLGLCHDLQTITAAIQQYRNDHRLLFTFAGGGTGKASLESMCRAQGIENVDFAPYASPHYLSEHLGQADVGLVTERAACIGTVVPSKLYGLMAAGKPILFIGPRCSTPDLLIRRFDCGWQIDPGDTQRLFGLLEHLAANPDEIIAPGQRARKALEQHYDISDGVGRVARLIGVRP